MQQIIRNLWIVARPFVRLYWRITRPLTLGVRALVRDEAGRVMLVRHSYIRGWYMPGGGVERGETAVSAITRELDEEAGILLTSPPRLIGFLANFREFKSDHVALYLVEAGQYTTAPRKSFEIADYGFYALDALPEGISRSTRARLMEAAQGIAPPDHW